MRDMHIDTFDRCVERRMREEECRFRVKVLPSLWNRIEYIFDGSISEKKEKGKREKRKKKGHAPHASTRICPDTS